VYITLLLNQEVEEQLTLSSDTVSGNAVSGTLVGRFLLDGVSSSSVTYSLPSGVINNSLYHISGDSLMTAKDFEYTMALDHEIQVKVISMTASLRNLTIHIQETDANNTDQLTLSSDMVSGNAVSGTLVGMFLLDGVSSSSAIFSLPSGVVNNDLYHISGDSLMTATDFAYNQSIDHLVQVKTSVSGTSFLNLLQINVQINQVPQINNQQFYVIENDTSSTFIGQIEASDPDGDSLVFDIISGNGSGIFELSESGMLYLFDADLMELNAEYDLIIEVDDGYHQNFAIISIVVDPVPLGFTVVEFNIYPNPSKGIINIKMAAFKEATIYNLSGKRIMRSTDNRIDISALSEGVYIIKLEDRSGVSVSTKLVKE
jgi:hypothetical protein